MAYSVLNQNIYIAAFSGAMAGMGASERVIDSGDPLTYELAGKVAAAFAQSIDTQWGGSRDASLLDVDVLEETCEGFWDGRTLEDSTRFQRASYWTKYATAIIALITQAEAQFTADGIDPGVVGGGGNVLIYAPGGTISGAISDPVKLAAAAKKLTSPTIYFVLTGVGGIETWDGLGELDFGTAWTFLGISNGDGTSPVILFANGTFFTPPTQATLGGYLSFQPQAGNGPLFSVNTGDPYNGLFTFQDTFGLVLDPGNDSPFFDSIESTVSFELRISARVQGGGVLATSIDQSSEYDVTMFDATSTASDVFDNSGIYAVSVYPSASCADVDSATISSFVTVEGTGFLVDAEPNTLGVGGGPGALVTFVHSAGPAFSEVRVNPIGGSHGNSWVGMQLAKGVATAARPTNPAVFTMLWDTTLGKPIWYQGAGVWKDATGAAV